MIDYIKLYDEINNSLTDDAIAYLVERFSIKENLYHSLTRKYSSNKKSIDEQSIEPNDDLFSFLFYLWRKNVLSLSEGTIRKYINIGIVDNDYFELTNQLNDIKQIKTKDEFYNLLKNNKLMYKYGWQSIGNNSSWTHIDSSLLNAWKGEQNYKIEHRLYLNCNCSAVEKIVEQFVRTCSIRNLPFYLKYKTNENRDDTIVIYTNTKNLSDHIEVLKYIRIYNKEFFKENVFTPPLLSGNIEGWLGYGSENKDYKKVSFNDIRTRIIANAIDDAVSEWTYENRGQIIKFKDTDVHYFEYLAINLANKTLKKYNYLYSKYVEENKEDEFINDYGITKFDLQSDVFKQDMINHINEKIVFCIINKYQKEKIEDIIIKTKNNKKIIISDSDIKNIIRGGSYELLKHYPEFMILIKNNIAKEARKYNVDMENFCFDTRVKDLMFDYQKRKKR